MSKVAKPKTKWEMRARSTSGCCSPLELPLSVAPPDPIIPPTGLEAEASVRQAKRGAMPEPK